MRCLVLCIFLSLSFSLSLFANDNGIEVRILQPIINAVPSQVVTLQAEVINKSSKNRILVGHLELPPLWEAIPSNDMLMHIEIGQRFIQTVMVKAPENVSPGEYPIAYEVWVRDNVSIMDRDKASVIIGKTCSTNPVSIEVTSAPICEVNPDELIFFSALVCNITQEPFVGRLRLATPEGWNCSPGGFVDLCLEPEESQVLIFGIKVSHCALAGEHPITLHLEEFEDCKRSCIAVVKPKVEVSVDVEGLCDEFNLNQMAQLYVRYTNKGNVSLKVLIETKTEPPCPVECSSEPFEIKAHESCEIPIYLSPESCMDEYSQYLLVKLVNAETGEQLYQNPMTLKFVAPGSRINDPYVRIPAYGKAMVLGDRYKNIFAGEFAGGGLIDQEKDRYIDFFFRIPTDARHVIYNIDERIYAGMHDREWDVRLGDTVYELSPLTQRYRYGRGAGVQHLWEQWEAGVHYTQNTLKCQDDPHEFCSYLSYSPYDNVDFAANYLHKVEQHIPTSNIVTLQSIVEYPEKVVTEVEFGKDFVPRTRNKDNWSYRFETHGRFCGDSWFSLEKVYAGPEFYGYYNNIHLFSSSLDFPVYDRLRLNLSTNRFTQNISFCSDDDFEEIIPRQNQYAANLTYCLNSACSIGLNGMLLRGKDLGLTEQYNFYQKWAGFSFYLSSRGYNFNTIVSFGQQKDYLTHRTTHWLQRYYAYLCKDFSPTLRGSLFYDSGNINYYDARPWRNGFGGSLSYRFAPMGFIEIFLQRLKHTADMLDLSQVTVNFNYTFNNLHRLQAMVQHYHYRKHYPNDSVFLVSYAIPFSLPVCRRTDIGDLNGYIYNQNDFTPVSGAMLLCGPDRVSTGPDGRFSFPCITAGVHCPNFSMLPDDLIGVSSDKLEVDVPGGAKTEICIPVVPACSIRGEIILYNYKDLFAILISPENAEIVPQNGLQGVRVAIARKEEKEIYSCMTNEKGEFRFPKLRPGEWHIRIFKDVIPPLHELDMNDLVFEVLPGEERAVNFKVKPTAPEVYKLEK